MHPHPSDGSGPPQPLQHLLIGQREEDYFIIQDLLRTNGRVLAASLDQASSFADAQTRLTRKSYDLLLLEHESSEDEALQILRELRLRNQTIPACFSPNMRMRQRSPRSFRPVPVNASAGWN